MAIVALPVKYGYKRAPRIGQVVRELQNEIWARRHELWRGNPPMHRIGVLEPAVALEMLGYRVVPVSSLGEFCINGVASEAAGEIDTHARVVKISQRQLVPEQRFTLAHELGHAVCHPGMGRMHRDVPLGMGGISRNPQEVEANHFASTFLMPASHVRHHFSKRYLDDRLDLTSEEVSYALCGTNTDNIRSRFRSLRPLSRFVAGAESFNGARFQSLASLFGVSITAMAIRLEELDLICY